MGVLSEDIWGRLPPELLQRRLAKKPCALVRPSHPSEQTDICSNARPGKTDAKDWYPLVQPAGGLLDSLTKTFLEAEREREPQKQSEKELPWNSRELPLVG
jgi:hypothetical protein